MTPEQRKHFEFVRDEMHGEPQQQKHVVEMNEKVREKCCVGGVAHDCHVGPNCKVMLHLKAKLAGEKHGN